MHNLESVLENETQKPPWKFEIKTDHIFSVRQQNLVIVNNKKKKKGKENQPHSGLWRSS